MNHYSTRPRILNSACLPVWPGLIASICEIYYPVEILGPQEDSDMGLIGLVYKRNVIRPFITLPIGKKMFN